MAIDTLQGSIPAGPNHMPATVVNPDVFAGRSVVEEPKSIFLGEPGGLHDIVINLATAADEIPPWGFQPGVRDRLLRSFWPTEPVLASALYETAARYAAFGWHLNGPPRMVGIIQRMLHGVEFGEGWVPFITKVLIDLFSQDNGAFIEVVRTDDDPRAPVVSLNHLDSSRCIRTGHRDLVLYYWDINGHYHEMMWYQVIRLAECPSPIERMRGMQYCAVTRMLRAAQIMRDISIYKSEKISGRFNRAIHLVGGVHGKTLEDTLAQQRASADSSGLLRYVQPLIVAGLDPNTRISKETIELASLPDGFDFDMELRWYINQLALAFGVDYQDFAPLPGGNLGTSAQSQMLHQKARGKGPAIFMRLMEHVFNFHGVIPSTVTFGFGEQDMQAELENIELKQARATERATRIASLEITPQVAAMMAFADGDITADQLAMLGIPVGQPEITASSSIPAEDGTTDLKISASAPVVP